MKKFESKSSFMKTTIFVTLMAFAVVGCSGGKSASTSDTVTPGTDNILSQKVAATPVSTTDTTANEDTTDTTGTDTTDTTTDETDSSAAADDATTAKLDEILGKLNNVESKVDKNNDKLKFLKWAAILGPVALGVGLLFATKYTNGKLDKKTDEIKAKQEEAKKDRLAKHNSLSGQLTASTAALGTAIGVAADDTQAKIESSSRTVTSDVNGNTNNGFNRIGREASVRHAETQSSLGDLSGSVSTVGKGVSANADALTKQARAIESQEAQISQLGTDVNEGFKVSKDQADILIASLEDHGKSLNAQLNELEAQGGSNAEELKSLKAQVAENHRLLQDAKDFYSLQAPGVEVYGPVQQ